MPAGHIHLRKKQKGIKVPYELAMSVQHGDFAACL
jgi:hypothetical protein